VKKVLIMAANKQVPDTLSFFRALTRRVVFWRAAFYVAGIAVCVISLLPGDALPPLPDISDKVEHAACYAVLATLAGLAYRPVAPHGAALVGVILLGGALEIAQLWVPGRSAEWGDAGANTAGAIVGFCLYRLGTRHRRGWLASN
jgi:VanZ family protein